MFQSHGEIDLQWRSDLLLVRASGSFNIEGITEGLEQIRKMVRNSGLKRWRRLEILDAQALAPLEGVDLVRSNYYWGMHRGCRSIAIVCSILIQAELLAEGHFASFSADIAAFETEEAAIEWLRHRERDT